MKKKCTNCKIEKDEKEFSFRNIKLNKRLEICKSCHRIKMKDHYKNNKKYYINKARKNEKKNI